MSARHRARLSQQPAIPAETLDDDPESEEEDIRENRKPAFVFDDSDEESEEDESEVEESPDPTEEPEQAGEEVDEPEKKEVDTIRERNSNFKKKKRNEVNTTNVEKAGDFEAISIEELSALISSAEMKVSSDPANGDEKDDRTATVDHLSAVLRVDVKGLDIDSIMRRRFGGMAVNELPEAGGGGGGGGAQRRRFAAAVNGAETARARIAKLSNKVSV